MNIKLFAITVTILAQTQAPRLAWAGEGSGAKGGGDEIGLQAATSLRQATANLSRYGEKLLPPESLKKIMAIADRLLIIAVDRDLPALAAGLTQNGLAYSQSGASSPVTLINRVRWSASADPIARQGIMAHEALVLAGIEKTGDYRISSEFVRMLKGDPRANENSAGGGVPNLSKLVPGEYLPSGQDVCARKVEVDQAQGMVYMTTLSISRDDPHFFHPCGWGGQTQIFRCDIAQWPECQTAGREWKYPDTGELFPNGPVGYFDRLTPMKERLFLISEGRFSIEWFQQPASATPKELKATGTFTLKPEDPPVDISGLRPGNYYSDIKSLCGRHVEVDAAQRKVYITMIRNKKGVCPSLGRLFTFSCDKASTPQCKELVSPPYRPALGLSPSQFPGTTGEGVLTDEDLSFLPDGNLVFDYTYYKPAEVANVGAESAKFHP